MQITITGITVMRGNGPDRIHFHTTLTPAVWPFNSPPDATIVCAAGQAEEWLSANGFTLPFTVIEV